MNLPLIMALVAAAGIILIFMGLAGSRSVDPVQARLTQLGSMQARTLEEIELQQPFFERSIRPLAVRLSGLGQRFTSRKKGSRTEHRLAMAGNPADLKTSDFLGLKVVVALGTAGVTFLVLGLLMGSIGLGIFAAPLFGIIGFFAPEFWLSRRIKK